MEYASGDLGGAIRALREAAEPKLTQAELGSRAGYGAGAGVSISRIESGLSRPAPDRLERIANALGVTVIDLERRAAKRSGARTGKSSAAATRSDSLKRRAERLQQTIRERTVTITKLSDSFNAEHDRARDEFFMPFVEAAMQIEGAPQPPEPNGLDDAEASDPETAADFRLGLSSSGIAKAIAGLGGAAAGTAVGGAAAYGAFTAVAAFGTASTGAAIGGLSGAAGTSAALAWFGGGAVAAGGAGVAGGTMVLASIVAAPAAALAIGGLLWMVRRNKQKETELRRQIEEAEAEIAATEEGYAALARSLARSTSLLSYIATYGSHAARRWLRELGEMPLLWSEMSPDAQKRYTDFTKVAACQLTAANINTGAFLTARGDALRLLVERGAEDLAAAERAVEALV